MHVFFDISSLFHSCTFYIHVCFSVCICISGSLVFLFHCSIKYYFLLFYHDFLLFYHCDNWCCCTLYTHTSAAGRGRNVFTMRNWCTVSLLWVSPQLKQPARKKWRGKHESSDWSQSLQTEAAATHTHRTIWAAGDKQHPKDPIKQESESWFPPTLTIHSVSFTVIFTRPGRQRWQQNIQK